AAGGEIALDALMVVPDLTVNEKLNETHAALDQPPRNQATRPIFTNHRFVEAIKLLGRFTFPGNIQGLLRRSLHAGSEFVTGNAGLQIALSRMPLKVLAIQAGKERQVLGLQLASQMRWRFEIQNARLGRTNNRSLKQRRHPTVGPIAHPINGVPPRI